MNKITLLLPPDAMTRISTMSGGIDIDKLTPSIFSAQITEIKRVLTPALYNKIVFAYETDTLVGNYKIIWEDYVIDMLAYWSVRDYIKIGSFSIGNSGIFKNTPDNVTLPDYSEIMKLADHYGYLGHSIENLFLDFMKTITIPEYPSGTVDSQKGSSGLNMYF